MFWAKVGNKYYKPSTTDGSMLSFWQIVRARSCLSVH